jgi:hypothetical protein
MTAREGGCHGPRCLSRLPPMRESAQRNSQFRNRASTASAAPGRAGWGGVPYPRRRIRLNSALRSGSSRSWGFSSASGAGMPLAAHTVPRKKPSEKKNAAMAMAIMRVIQICGCIEISVARVCQSLPPLGYRRVAARRALARHGRRACKCRARKQSPGSKGWHSQSRGVRIRTGGDGWPYAARESCSWRSSQ